jgi:antitoxin HigA-1
MGLKADFIIKVHPGEILQMMLDQTGVTQTKLAEHIGVTQSKVSEICTGRRGISAEMAVKLAKAFGQDPLFWLDAQQRWELSQIDQSRFKIKRLVIRPSKQETKAA